jgi:hypothetical protein
MVRMAYIEENLKLRTQARQGDADQGTSSDANKTQDGMEKFGDKYKTHGIELKEGSVTSSLAMLSAIPEVDLGMEYVLSDIDVHRSGTHFSDSARLRNIEETEKAKRAPAEEKAARASKRPDSDEARLAATRCKCLLSLHRAVIDDQQFTILTYAKNQTRPYLSRRNTRRWASQLRKSILDDITLTVQRWQRMRL